MPSAFLLAIYHAGTSKLSDSLTVKLFIPKAEQVDLMWSVPPPSLETAKQTYDVNNVDHLSALPGAIEALMEAHPDALFHTLPRNSPLFPTLPEEYVNIVLGHENGATTDFYLLPALHRARLIKDDSEIEAIRHANGISSRAHEVVMRALGQAVQGKIVKCEVTDTGRLLLPGEWLIEKEAEAEAIFVASCRREGCERYFKLGSSMLMQLVDPLIKHIFP